MATFERTRPAVGAQAIGNARAASEVALDYAGTREQFGKPIIENQAIAFALADMATQIEAARLMVWRAAWLASQGKPFEKAEGSMSKLFAGETAVRVTEKAMQILGGNGYVGEYVVERLWRDAKLLEIGGGTSEAHEKNMARDLSKVDRLARCARRAHLGGHLRDPAARHRPHDLRRPHPLGVRTTRSGPVSSRNSWLSLGALTAVGWVVVWVLLLWGAIVEDPGLAVAASVAALAWAGMCVVLTYRNAALPRVSFRPRKDTPPRRWWSGEWWLIPLMAVLVSPAATHWLAGRTRGGRLRFGEDDAGLVEVAQVMGWVAVALVLLGCPVAWLVGRGRGRGDR